MVRESLEFPVEPSSASKPGSGPDCIRRDAGALQFARKLGLLFLNPILSLKERLCSFSHRRWQYVGVDSYLGSALEA